MYLLVNLYAAGVSVYFGGDLDGARLREDFLDPFANFMARLSATLEETQASEYEPGGQGSYWEAEGLLWASVCAEQAQHR